MKKGKKAWMWMMVLAVFMLNSSFGFGLIGDCGSLSETCSDIFIYNVGCSNTQTCRMRNIIDGSCMYQACDAGYYCAQPSGQNTSCRMPYYSPAHCGASGGVIGKTGADIKITDALGVGPSIARNPSNGEYGVAWMSNKDGNYEIYFARIDASGNKIGTDVRITTADGDSGSPSLVWTGTEYGVAWEDDRDGNDEIYFARISSTGTKIGSDLRVTNNIASSHHPSLVWKGDEYAVVWDSNNADILFAKITASGTKVVIPVNPVDLVDGDIEITVLIAGSTYPSIVWNSRDNRFGIAWTYDGTTDRLLFVMANTTGNFIPPTDKNFPTGIEVYRSIYSSDLYIKPSLVWTGSEYGVVFKFTNSIRFAKTTSNGETWASPTIVTSTTPWGSFPSLVWTGSEYGVSWVRDLTGGNYEIYFTILNSTGNKIDVNNIPPVNANDEIRITNATGMSVNPRLTWTGSGYSAAWQDDTDGSFKVYFTKIGCKPTCTDLDFDTYGAPATDLSACTGSTTLADCNDAVSAVNPGAAEICTDVIDNNCNLESDYDSMDGMHGDTACPVGVTSISVSSATPVAGSSIDVNCISSVADVNSISADIDGVLCAWQSWSGSTAIFNCNVGLTTGAKTVKCFVDTTKSYKSGNDQTTTINVLPSLCSDYTASLNCNADARCGWCNQCSGVKYTGSANRCVNTGTCPTPYCWKGQCGATCDNTNGGCTAGYDCDTTTCSCKCTPTSEICDDKDNNCDGQIDETFTNKGQSCTVGVGACQTAGTYVCKADGSGTECFVPGGLPSPRPEICDGIDNNCDGQIDENFGATTCGIGACQITVQNCVGGIPQTCTPGAPAETPETSCGDGIDNDCDGLIDLADSDCQISCTDNDIDTYGAEGTDLSGCSGSITQSDCDDNNNAINPAAAEICDGLDNNCNGIIDEGCISLSPLIYYVEYMGEIYPEGVEPYWQKITVIDGKSSLTGIYDYLWDVTDIPGQAIDIKITPFDGFFNATPVIVHTIIDRTGDISGKVECCNEQGANCVPVAYATVAAGDKSTIADKNGDYSLADILMGTYRVVASNTGNRSQRIEDVDVEAQKETIDVNFDKVCPITIDCNPDCTVKGTETQAYTTCDPRCNGINGCELNPHCEYAAKGSRVQYVDDTEGLSYEVICCTGTGTLISTTEEKSKLEVDAKNIARTTRIVYYKGKPVKMVVVTWD